MFCHKCGNEMGDNEKYCSKCGAENKEYDGGREQNGRSAPSIEAENDYNMQHKLHRTGSEERCLPAFILGLIGSIMGIFGGFCVTMCASMAMVNMGGAAFIFIFGVSVVGMIGACQCLKNVKRGSILQLIGAVMIIICAYGITGADLMSVLAFLLLLIGGIIGLVDYYVIKKK